MSFKSREAYNAYMRGYMLDRYHRRIKEAKEKLGNKCTHCGVTDRLQFDHKDPSTKNFELGSVGPGVSEARFQKELQLCQLLCVVCHTKKTCVERGQQYVKGMDVHGTLSSYRYCKCSVCKEAWNKWQREYKKKTGLVDQR